MIKGLSFVQIVNPKSYKYTIITFFDIISSSLQSKTITNTYYSFSTKHRWHPIMDGREAAFLYMSQRLFHFPNDLLKLRN